MIEYVSENTKLVDKLSKLRWDKYNKIYKEILPKDKDFPKNFYQSVNLVNRLTIIGYYIYINIPEDSDDKQFLEFFISNAYQSEYLIWNQRGIMQCYYYEGLKWQRGTLIDSTLDNNSIFPILSSSVVDSVIALIIKYLKDPNIILWLSQEQQNYASTSLLTEYWSYPIDTISNPPVFKNINNNITNPHRLIFGPSTWLAMGIDIIDWNHSKTIEKYNKYIIKGKQLWIEVGKYININKELLKRVPYKLINIQKYTTKTMDNNLNKLLENIFRNSKDNVNKLMNYLRNDYKLVIDPNIIKNLSEKKAKHVLDNIQISLENAINSLTINEYKNNLSMVVDNIKYFYCNGCNNKCIFIDPRVKCA